MNKKEEGLCLHCGQDGTADKKILLCRGCQRSYFCDNRARVKITQEGMQSSHSHSPGIRRRLEEARLS